MILESMEPDGVIGRLAVLCDFDLCTYREHMGVEQRTGGFAGTWAFRSAISQYLPLKSYHLSDDIESFVHVFHYLVFRFYKTTTHSAPALRAMVMALYEHEENVIDARTGRHLLVGGRLKLHHMLHGIHPIVMDPSYSTLEALLCDIAALCREHYASLNVLALRRQYEHTRPEEQDNTRKGAQEKYNYVLKVGPEEDEPAVNTAPATSNGDSSLMRVDATTSSASTSPSTAIPTLGDHAALINLLLQYASWERWRNQGLVKSSEDLFVEARITPRHRNAFSTRALRDPSLQ